MLARSAVLLGGLPGEAVPPGSGQGTCTIKQNACLGNKPPVACGVGGVENPNCGCLVTTTGASFCGGPALAMTGTGNRDCVEQGAATGSACVRVRDGVCASFLPGLTARFEPCPAAVSGAGR